MLKTIGSILIAIGVLAFSSIWFLNISGGMTVNALAHVGTLGLFALLAGILMVVLA